MWGVGGDGLSVPADTPTEFIILMKTFFTKF